MKIRPVGAELSNEENPTWRRKLLLFAVLRMKPKNDGDVSCYDTSVYSENWVSVIQTEWFPNPEGNNKKFGT